MKTHLSVFALSAILVVSIGMAPAFGQIQNSISVTTDKTSYSDGEIITVTGEVRDLYSGFDVSVVVMSPDGNNRVYLDQVKVGADKKFSSEFTAGGGLMKQMGEYSLTVTYGSVTRTATTSFEFGGSTMTPPTDIVDDSKVTDTTVQIGDNASDLIGYKITGGKLLSITPDVDQKSLIISIQAIEDGSLTLTIPRSIADALDENGEDDEYFVLIDQEEAEDFDEVITSTERILTIAFPAGSEEIEIIGTFVIPEFGTIAAMILAVAIISIIAVSAKSRLSIMPRY